MNKIGQNIRALRQQRGWSQADVAKWLKISVPALSKIETGATSVTLCRLNQIALTFQIKTIQLISLDKEDAHFSEIAAINNRLAIRDAEVRMLLQKIINLSEEAYNSSSA
jgi:transcriptional regulator with XRE-family HTH domain